MYTNVILQLSLIYSLVREAEKVEESSQKIHVSLHEKMSIFCVLGEFITDF